MPDRITRHGRSSSTPTCIVALVSTGVIGSAIRIDIPRNYLAKLCYGFQLEFRLARAGRGTIAFHQARETAACAGHSLYRFNGPAHDNVIGTQTVGVAHLDIDFNAFFFPNHNPVSVNSLAAGAVKNNIRLRKATRDVADALPRSLPNGIIVRLNTRARGGFLMAHILIEGFLCERCQYRWVPHRSTKNEPKICPKCKSAYWNRPRKLDWPVDKRAAQHDQRI